MIGEASLLELVFNLFFFLLLVFFSYKNTKSNSVVNNWLVFIGIVTFCVYAYWGRDFFRYEDIFNTYKTIHELGHVEDAYDTIYSLSPNYSVFRLLLWGGAFMVLLVAFHRIKLKTNVFLFLFVAFYLLRFSYARVSLGVAIMFLGYSFFVNPLRRNTLLSYIIGIAILAFSVGFHKSMALAIFPIPFAFMKWNKKTMLIALLIAFPLLSTFVSTSLVDFILERNLIEDESTLADFNSYLEDSGKESGWGIIIADILQLLPFYLTIIHCFVNYDKLGISIDRKAGLAMGLLFTTVIVATAFVFRQQLIFRRVIYMTYPALIATVSCILEKEGYSRWVRRIISIALIYQFYELAYAIYCL